MLESELQAQPEGVRLSMEDARGRRYPRRAAVGGGTCSAIGVAENGCSSSVPARSAGGVAPSTQRCQSAAV
eukprot:1201229-Prorocentrum_lima.AAC.1